MGRGRWWGAVAGMAGCLAACAAGSRLEAQAPPALSAVFPAGGRAGTVVELTVVGGPFGASADRLLSNAPGVIGEPTGGGKFRLTIPAATPPGHYDLWASTAGGASGPRSFVIGDRPESTEVEPNDVGEQAGAVEVGTAVHGRLEKPGDVDQFRVALRGGRRLVVECQAERIDSRLRAVLELFGPDGRRAAVNRGYYGVDPLLDVRVPADGLYTLKVQDLTGAGGVEYGYRLELDDGPRIAFAHPMVATRDRPGRATLFGWNLNPPSSGAGGSNASGSGTGSAGIVEPLERMEVEWSAEQLRGGERVRAVWHPSQAPLVESTTLVRARPGERGLLLGLTDAPVVEDGEANHSPQTARSIDVPCEASGRLAEGDERDWYAWEARRGEVFYFEAYGRRAGSPVDLQLTLYDGAGRRILGQWTDEVRNRATAFSTAHLDPEGRWVCPADGRYCLEIRNVTGGTETDERRVYRLSVRREEPDFQVLATVRRADAGGLSLRRGGREAIELVALRRRGFQESIRVSATGLPPGATCPDVWLGPGVERATAVVSCDADVPSGPIDWRLRATSESGLERPVLSAAVVRTGTPGGWGRLTSGLPTTVIGEASGAAPVRISATLDDEVQHPLYGKLRLRPEPGGVVDVAVRVEFREAGRAAPVRLTAVGLPESIGGQATIGPAGSEVERLSFYLPPGLAPGRYSWCVQAETTVPGPDGKPAPTTVVSDPVTIEVRPAAMQVAIDPFVGLRVRRGETVQVPYTVRRVNGFIGKLHTELATAGLVTDVPGLRGRGETFVGQTEQGTLQIVVNDDAPFGRAAGLRLLTVGVVEDEPAHFGACFLPLEVVE